MSSLIVVWDNDSNIPEDLVQTIKFHDWVGPIQQKELKELPDLPTLTFYKPPVGKFDWWQWIRAASLYPKAEMAQWVLNRNFPLIDLTHDGHISEAGIFPESTRDGFFPSGIVYKKDRKQISTEKVFIPAMETKRSLIATSEYRGALLLDRDGIINQDRGYVFRDQDLQWEELGVRLIALAKQYDYDVHVLTNQSGIGRGYYREEEVQVLHLQMNDHLSSRGLSIDSWSYCPFHPKGVAPYDKKTQMRKPGPGMLVELLSNWPIDPQNMVMVGDKASDRLNYSPLPVFLIKKQYDIPDNVRASVFSDENLLIEKVEEFFRADP